MSSPTPTRPAEKTSSRRNVVFFLTTGVLVLFAVILWQSSFTLNVSPDTNQQLLSLVVLSAVIFFLFLAMTLVLGRNLLKLFAERKLGVLGSKFRTRLVIGGLILSFLPVIMMFWFAYGLMNRSIDKWFSQPVEEVRQDTASMLSLLSNYAAQNARSEAQAIASSPETQRAFEGHSFSTVVNEFRSRSRTHRCTSPGSRLNTSWAALRWAITGRFW